MNCGVHMSQNRMESHSDGIFCGGIGVVSKLIWNHCVSVGGFQHWLSGFIAGFNVQAVLKSICDRMGMNRLPQLGNNSNR